MNKDRKNEIAMHAIKNGISAEQLKAMLNLGLAISEHMSKQYAEIMEVLDEMFSDEKSKKADDCTPFVPKEGEKYYFVQISNGCGWEYNTNRFHKYDKLILSRIKVYRTKEEVVAKVKELGWEVE